MANQATTKARISVVSPTGVTIHIRAIALLDEIEDAEGNTDKDTMRTNTITAFMAIRNAMETAGFTVLSQEAEPTRMTWSNQD